MSFDHFFSSPDFDFDSEKEKFITNMNMLKDMSNEEYTLYKKWVEVQNYSRLMDRSKIVKANIWTPRDLTDLDKTIEDVENLDPVVKFVPSSDSDGRDEWLILRAFVHSMEFEQNPGRFIRFTVVDNNTGKYLGVASLGSDIISIGCRDEWIGWELDHKIKSGILKHSAIATTICSTQPLGFNFLGGKLVASLMCTDVVKDAWEETYGEKLVGITTTSLYGKHSMYQRIPFWKEMGETKGKITLKPDPSQYESWHHYIKDAQSELYEKRTTGGGSGPATGIKQKILSLIMKELGMVQSHYTHGFKRGVYYSPFYENTREFLRGEIDEKDLVPNKKLDKDREAVLDWWRPKATKRYKNLLNKGRLNDQVLYYNDLFNSSWDYAKKKYLKEVGR